MTHMNTVRGYSFLDYVRGGTELACTISIDFTQSNGIPTDPRSLHYMHSRTPNQYEQAIKSVGEIIEDYDSDKLFPVLGFGARLPPDGRVSHCFFVNGHDSNPFCERMPGVLAAYKSCVQRVQLYGPTNFAPTVEHVASFARQHRDGSQYFILLIITDGIITDMPQTQTVGGRVFAEFFFNVLRSEEESECACNGINQWSVRYTCEGLIFLCACVPR